MDINVNLKATQDYYESAADEKLCDCDYCRNYCRQVKAAYPEVAEYLAGLGIDIEKPFETLPLEPDEDGYLEYCICQYVAFGTCSAEYHHRLGDVEFGLSTSHPNTGIDANHFVIDIYPIRLKYLP